MQVKLEHVIDLDRSYASVNKNNIIKDTRVLFSFLKTSLMRFISFK